MTMTLYGLKNCDTCRKARQWLANAGIEARCVDLRDDGIDASRLAGWVKAEGWETLLNRRSRTWRELPPENHEHLDADKALTLMQQHPTLIKRPVLEHSIGLMVGFSAAEYATTLAGAE